MKKNIILLLTTFSLYTITLAKSSDVVSNPDLNSLSAATNTFNQLRNLSIKDFEKKLLKNVIMFLNLHNFLSIIGVWLEMGKNQRMRPKSIAKS